MHPPAAKNASAPASILAAAIGLSSLGSPDSPGKPSTNDAAQRNMIPTMTMMPHTHTPAHAGHFMDPRGLPMMPSHAGFGAMMHPTMPCANPLPLPPLSSAAATMDQHVMADRVTAVNRAAALAPGARPSLYGPYYPYHHAPQGMMMMSHAMLPHTAPLQITPIPNTKNFPETLFDVVSTPEHAHIISWLPHGKGFIIHDKQRFAAMILPRYFDGAKFTSFTRRLKRWSFVRTPRGPELGAYYNKNFARGMPELVQEMRYRMDGQFEEAKGRSIISKDGKECHEQGKKSNEEPEKEGETKAKVTKKTKAKVQESPSKKEERRLSAKITSPEIKPSYMANSQFQDPYSVRQAVTSNIHQRVANIASSEFVGNHRPRALTESSLVTPPSPALVSVSPNDHTQREMMLARTAMSHVAGMGLTPGPAGGACARSVATSRHQGLPYHADLAAPRGVINAQSARLLLESERAALGHAVPGGFPADRYRPQDDGRFRGEARDVAARGMQARMAHPFVNYPERPEGSSMNPPARQSRGGPYYDGVQPVLMSRQEETEFADYLSMKRESANVRQWP